MYIILNPAGLKKNHHSYKEISVEPDKGNNTVTCPNVFKNQGVYLALKQEAVYLLVLLYISEKPIRSPMVEAKKKKTTILLSVARNVTKALRQCTAGSSGYETSYHADNTTIWAHGLVERGQVVHEQLKTPWGANHTFIKSI